MRLSERNVFLLALFVAMVFFTASALSQTFEKGEISGIAFDPSGAVVPNAGVKIIHVPTGTERLLTTGPDGRYVAGILPVGEYRIEVTAAGFGTTVVKGVQLAVGQHLVQNVTMKIARAGETLEVTAETVTVDKSDPLENTVIGRRYIEDLPINGRDFREFVNLSPTADTTPGLRSPVRLGGQLGEYTELIADRLGVDEKMKREIGFGALLHDVGKIAVPDQILMKPDKLTDGEWEEMRRHPEAGYRIVKRIGFLKHAAEIVYAHHEQYDGEGYPRGLKGEDIPLGARMFMVADVYDALTSERPYRSPMTYEEVAAEIKRLRGSHFDPAVVDTFLTIAPEQLQEIARHYQE